MDFTYRFCNKLTHSCPSISIWPAGSKGIRNGWLFSCLGIPNMDEFATSHPFCGYPLKHPEALFITSMPANPGEHRGPPKLGVAGTV